MHAYMEKSLYSVFYLGIGKAGVQNNVFLSTYPDVKKLTGYFLNRFSLSLNESKRIAAILSNYTILDGFSGEILAEDRRGIYKYFKSAFISKGL